MKDSIHTLIDSSSFYQRAFNLFEFSARGYVTGNVVFTKQDILSK